MNNNNNNNNNNKNKNQRFCGYINKLYVQEVYGLVRIWLPEGFQLTNTLNEPFYIFNNVITIHKSIDITNAFAFFVFPKEIKIVLRTYYDKRSSRLEFYIDIEFIGKEYLSVSRKRELINAYRHQYDFLNQLEMHLHAHRMEVYNELQNTAKEHGISFVNPNPTFEKIVARFKEEPTEPTKNKPNAN